MEQLYQPDDLVRDLGAFDTKVPPPPPIKSVLSVVVFAGLSHFLEETLSKQSHDTRLGMPLLHFATSHNHFIDIYMGPIVFLSNADADSPDQAYSRY